MVNPMVKDIKQYVITVNHYWICLPVVLFLGTTKIVVAENVFLPPTGHQGIGKMVWGSLYSHQIRIVNCST